MLQNLKEVYRVLLEGLNVSRVTNDTVIITMLDQHVMLLTNFAMQNKIYKSIRKKDKNIKHIYFTTNKLLQNMSSYGDIISIKKV